MSFHDLSEDLNLGLAETSPALITTTVPKMVLPRQHDISFETEAVTLVYIL